MNNYKTRSRDSDPAHPSRPRTSGKAWNGTRTAESSSTSCHNDHDQLRLSSTAPALHTATGSLHATMSAIDGNPSAASLSSSAALQKPLDDGSQNGSASSSQPVPEQAKKKRTKSGCITCRRRKVKCDEEKPTCSRCFHAKVECAGYAEPVLTARRRTGASATSTEMVSRRSSTASSYATSSSTNSAISSTASASRSGRTGSFSSFGPVRKAARLSNLSVAESPASYAPSPQAMDDGSYYRHETGTPQYAQGQAGMSRTRTSRNTSRGSLTDRNSFSNVSVSSMSTTTSPPVYGGSYGGHGPRSGDMMATVPSLSRAGSMGSIPREYYSSALTSTSTHASSSPFEAHSFDYRNQGINTIFRTDEDIGTSSVLFTQPAFSPTLAPPFQQPPIQPSQMQTNGNTYAPFAFDSPFPLQAFGSVNATLGSGQTNHHSSNSHIGITQQPTTPFGFDSLFDYTDKTAQQQQQQQQQQRSYYSFSLNDSLSYEQNDRNANGNSSGAPFPVECWEGRHFIDQTMTGFGNASANLDVQNGQHLSSLLDSQSEMTVDSSAIAPFGQVAFSDAPSLSSGKSSIISPSARTPSVASPTMSPFTTQGASVPMPHPQSLAQSPKSTTSDTGNKGRPLFSACQRRTSSAMSVSAAPPGLAMSTKTRTTTNVFSTANTIMADFAPQPAIDPILQATSTSALHKTAANRNKIVPSLNELAMGPPPDLLGNQKEWSIPPKIGETMKGMTNARHVELLKHCQQAFINKLASGVFRADEPCDCNLDFVNLVGLFSPVDHPKNPFRTFVAEHATESLSLLHAVLAVSAINQQPLSVEARAESLLYFEAAVDLYVRSLQQQDDISLFTLLFLSLYYAFDSGTAQPQHFSRRAQSIINERLGLLGYDVLQASNDFKFLIRLHVWYEVMANISRKPGDLRDMACGEYTLTRLIAIVENWDAQEEQAAGLSGVNPDYIMTGCVGVPTIFISLLNDISLLKEEQHTIPAMPADTLDEQVQQRRKSMISDHTRKIRDLECKIQFARPGRLLLPPIVANELQLHRAVSVRFFDLFRLAASIHLLVELQGLPVNDSAIQLRTTEMVNLLGNIEQNSNYNTSGIWAFFIAGAASVNHMDRIALHRRLDSTWNSPCGNVWSLRSVLDEVWQRNAEALENNEPCHNWKEIAQQRGWQLLLM